MESIYFRRGFTLIELMVVMAIIGVVSSIVISNQGSFNKSIILANAAYDVALSLRSVESYGVGGRVAGNITNAGYGMHFQSASPESFILFADIAGGASCAGEKPDCKIGDHMYTSGSDQFMQTYTLGNGVTISRLCAYSGISCSAVSSLDIVFTRPNPEAFVTDGAGASYARGACLTLTSPQGGFRYVAVTSSGQITASATSCP